MNLLNELQKDFDKTRRDKIISYIGNDQERYAELIHIFLNESSRISQRAAWPLSYCVQRQPGLVKPHLKKIVLNLRKQGLSDAVKRNTLRLLQFIEIPKSLHGQTLDICFAYLQNTMEPVIIPGSVT